ncbi:MAG TPA: putative quinol monooxygenase [Rhizomicrobium sp.]|nr:putative quinol monooxygenase [Rhizomicrobium sp.]
MNVMRVVRYAASIALAVAAMTATLQAQEIIAKKLFVVSVDFGTAPENFERFKQVMLENAKASVADEPGCRQFDVYEVATSPNHLFLYEVYEDDAAFQQHLNAPHFKKFSEAIATLVTSRANARGTMLTAYRKAR